METREEVATQMREMTVHDIITPQMKPTFLVSSLTYPCKAYKTLKVSWTKKI